MTHADDWHPAWCTRRGQVDEDRHRDSSHEGEWFEAWPEPSEIGAEPTSPFYELRATYELRPMNIARVRLWADWWNPTPFLEIQTLGYRNKAVISVDVARKLCDLLTYMTDLGDRDYPRPLA